MAGSARSDASVTLISVRVAGAPDYIPSHVANGKDKPTSQRTLFRVFHNSGGDKAHVFSLTAWGKLADACARGCAPGKEISIKGELNSYPAKVWKDGPNGAKEPDRNADGSFKMTTRVGIKVDRIIFGEDSATLTLDEISKGIRPPLYNVIGDPQEAAWKNICKQKNAEQFVPGAPMFGYAIVKVPANSQIVTEPQTGTGYAQPQGGGYAPQAPPTWQNPAAPQTPPQGGFQAPPATPQAPPAWQAPATQPQAYAPPQSQPTPPAYQPPAYAPPVAPGTYQTPPAPTGYGQPQQGSFAPAAAGYQPPVAPTNPAYAPPAYQPPVAPEGPTYQAPAAGGYQPPVAPAGGYQPPVAPQAPQAPQAPAGTY